MTNPGDQSLAQLLADLSGAAGQRGLARTLATMFGAGIPLVDSLETVAGSGQETNSMEAAPPPPPLLNAKLPGKGELSSWSLAIITAAVAVPISLVVGFTIGFVLGRLWT